MRGGFAIKTIGIVTSAGKVIYIPREPDSRVKIEYIWSGSASASVLSLTTKGIAMIRPMIIAQRQEIISTNSSKLLLL